MKVKVNEEVNQFEPGNPYTQDWYHMGMEIHGGIELMYSNGGEKLQYFYLVDKKTGSRVKIEIEY